MMNWCANGSDQGVNGVRSVLVSKVAATGGAGPIPMVDA